MLDVIRPKVWNDDSIPFWYKQNTFLVLHEQDCSDFGLQDYYNGQKALDIVHPQQFDFICNEYKQALAHHHKQPSKKSLWKKIKQKLST